MKTSTRKAVFSPTGKHCVLSKEYDFIEVTEWTNKEGYTINVSRDAQYLDVTDGEFDLIKKLIKKLRHESTTDI